MSATPITRLDRTAAAQANVSPTRHRRRRGLSRFALLVLGAALLLMCWSGFAYLASVGDTWTLNVSPHQPAAPPAGAGTALPAGTRVDVVATTPSGAFTVKNGAPHLDAGRQLFRVQVDPSRTSLTFGTFGWLDPMNSPFANGYVQVALYYQTATAGCDENAGDFFLTESSATYDELNESGTSLCFRAASTPKLLTSTVASARLSATDVPSRSYLYVIASILNSGHNAPPGQQPDLGSLQFLFMAR